MASLPRAEITVRTEFSAAHRLHAPELSDAENAELYGPCNNRMGHGHNYDLFVTVAGPIHPVTGMVMNLNDLHRLVKELVWDDVDHRHLDHDVEWMQGRVSTAENLAVAVWERLAPRVAEYEGVELALVRVHESRANIVEYRGG